MPTSTPSIFARATSLASSLVLGLILILPV